MLRRQFLKSAVAVPLVVPALGLILAGCGSSSGYSGGGSPAPQSGGDCNANGTVTSVGSNHGHTAPVINSADVVSGAQKTYVLMGAGHTHDVTLSAADFTQLQGNQGLVLQTDPDGTGHSHAISIGCA